MISIARSMAMVATLGLLGACTTLGGRDSGGDGGSSLGGGDGAASSIMKSMQGGLIGGQIGAGLSDGEKARALEAEYRALEYSQAGQPVAWKGDADTTFGQASAAQPYRVGSQDCRQYTQTVSRDGTTRVARGTACRNADGSWTPLL